MSSHEHINIESSQAKGRDKQTKDFLKSQFQRDFEQATTQVDSIQEKTNKPSAMSKLKDKGRSAFHSETHTPPTDRVNDQIRNLKNTLGEFRQKEDHEKIDILRSIPAEQSVSFAETFQALVQSFDTSSNGAVDHYGKWNSDIYRGKRHVHEGTLENTRAILSHMVEDLSTWHQFRTARRKEIEFCKDHEHEERRQELKNDLAKAKTIYAEVLKGYQKGEAEPPQRKFFREFVDGLGNALRESRYQDRVARMAKLAEDSGSLEKSHKIGYGEGHAGREHLRFSPQPGDSGAPQDSGLKEQQQDKSERSHSTGDLGGSKPGDASDPESRGYGKGPAGRDSISQSSDSSDSDLSQQDHGDVGQIELKQIEHREGDHPDVKKLIDIINRKLGVFFRSGGFERYIDRYISPTIKLLNEGISFDSDRRKMFLNSITKKRLSSMAIEGEAAAKYVIDRIYEINEVNEVNKKEYTMDSTNREIERFNEQLGGSHQESSTRDGEQSSNTGDGQNERKILGRDGDDALTQSSIEAINVTLARLDKFTPNDLRQNSVIEFLNTQVAFLNRTDVPPQHEGGYKQVRRQILVDRLRGLLDLGGATGGGSNDDDAPPLSSSSQPSDSGAPPGSEL